MFYKSHLSKPSLSDFKLIYPKSKLNRNIYKLWRWFFIGRISIYISWLAARCNLHPNFITVISFIFGLIGFLYISEGRGYNIFFGTLFINVWYLLDCSDGHLARYYKIKSNLGRFLDEAFGEIIMTFVWICFGWGLFNNPDLFMSFLTSFLKNINDVYIIICGAIISISIALRNCISGRFSRCYKDKINLNKNVKEKSLNKFSLYGIIKILWTNFMGIGGLQGPLLIIFSAAGYLSFLLIFYSILYFSYLMASTFYFIYKLNSQ